LSLACCSGRTRISLGGTPASVMVYLLPPIDGRENAEYQNSQITKPPET
jgi:hypothetical protein